MGFQSYNAEGTDNSNSEGKVDFNELNTYTIETAGLQEREVLTGYVSVICDLGTQEQEDAMVPFNGTEEDEAKAIAEKPLTYFEEGYDQDRKINCRMKRWPQAPRQAVAVAVDFPDIIIDKGQFFGESKPLPLRMWLGGQFYDGNNMICGRPTMLKIGKGSGVWSFDKKHLFHKMAVGAKIIGSNDAFMPERIDELLGQSFQFNVQIYMKANKGKEYYTEYCTFSSGLGRGVKPCELVTEPQLLQFFQPNDPEGVKELRAHIVNTAKKALNYEGSLFQKEVDEYRNGGGSTPQKSTSDEDDEGSQDYDEDVPDQTPSGESEFPEDDSMSGSSEPVDEDEPF